MIRVNIESSFFDTGPYTEAEKRVRVFNSALEQCSKSEEFSDHIKDATARIDPVKGPEPARILVELTVTGPSWAYAKQLFDSLIQQAAKTCQIAILDDENEPDVTGVSYQMGDLQLSGA